MPRRRLTIALMSALAVSALTPMIGSAAVIIDNDWNDNGQPIYRVLGGTGTYSSDFLRIGGPSPATDTELPYLNVPTGNPNTNAFVHYDSYAYTPSHPSGATATYSFTGLTPGDYWVWEFHRDYGGQDQNAEVRVFDGATLLGANNVNQDTPSAGATFNDFGLPNSDPLDPVQIPNVSYNWLPLTTGAAGPGGSYTITGTTLTVTISHDAASGNEVTRADAIRIQSVPEPASLLLLAAGAALVLRRR